MDARLYLPVMALAALLVGCGDVIGALSGEEGPQFPEPDRAFAEVATGSDFSSEDARDLRGEAMSVMDLAQLEAGMTVADIGAGEGYYTIRLAERVGPRGRVLAQDIDRNALERLGRRVEQQGLDNIAVKLGAEDDPQLPINSFDRIFLVHVYRYLGNPYGFIWRMGGSLAPGGEVVVVELGAQDADMGAGEAGGGDDLVTTQVKPPERTDEAIGEGASAAAAPMAISAQQLICEFEAVGYTLIEYVRSDQVDRKSYLLRFRLEGTLRHPEDIEPCPAPRDETRLAG